MTNLGKIGSDDRYIGSSKITGEVPVGPEYIQAVFEVMGKKKLLGEKELTSGVLLDGLSLAVTRKKAASEESKNNKDVGPERPKTPQTEMKSFKGHHLRK